VRGLEAYLIWGPIRAVLAIEVQGSEGSADEYQRNVADTFYLKPYGVSSGALGRRDYERPELITTLSDVGVPRGCHESCAGL